MNHETKGKHPRVRAKMNCHFFVSGLWSHGDFMHTTCRQNGNCWVGEVTIYDLVSWCNIKWQKEGLLGLMSVPGSSRRQRREKWGENKRLPIYNVNGQHIYIARFLAPSIKDIKLSLPSWPTKVEGRRRASSASVSRCERETKRSRSIREEKGAHRPRFIKIKNFFHDSG